VTLSRVPGGGADPELRSAWIAPGSFDELVASWSVEGDGAVEVSVQGRRATHETAWYLLGRRAATGWSSVAAQADADARVEVDVLVAEQPLEAFRLRVVAPGHAVVRALACCTTLTGGAREPAPRSGGDAAVEVPLEPLSQMAYRDADPELDGGGASWCSPTALAMVLRRWGVRVTVPEVARAVHDPVYGGCGNWSLNVAYAASHGLDAVVTRLGSLAEARPLLEAGIPLVASITAAPGALPGFPLPGGTRGHLVVVAGETPDGDPIVLDPAADDAAAVRRTYPRAAFERAWLGGSSGTVYLVRPADVPLPAGAGAW
jgi:hypothetical protein